MYFLKDSYKSRVLYLGLKLFVKICLFSYYSQIRLFFTLYATIDVNFTLNHLIFGHFRRGSNPLDVSINLFKKVWFGEIAIVSHLDLLPVYFLFIKEKKAEKDIRLYFLKKILYILCQQKASKINTNLRCA